MYSSGCTVSKYISEIVSDFPVYSSGCTVSKYITEYSTKTYKHLLTRQLIKMRKLLEKKIKNIAQIKSDKELAEKNNKPFVNNFKATKIITNY